LANLIEQVIHQVFMLIGLFIRWVISWKHYFHRRISFKNFLQNGTKAI